MKPHRAVLDTNVLVSALLSPSGNPAKIFKRFLANELVLVYSKEILAEYRDVLYRPHLNIPAADANTVLEAIQRSGEQIEPITSTDPMTDEDDRVFYDVAIGTDAYLITGNTRHYPKNPLILAPTEFLER